MIQNHLDLVIAAKQKYPEAWLHAHVEGDPRRTEWIQLCAADIHAVDAAVGNNGKRGNPGDLSADALNVLCASVDSEGRTPDGLPCAVVDVIAGAGGPTPTPSWSVYTTLIEGSGAHVQPGAVVPPVPPPVPVQPYPDEPTWWVWYTTEVKKRYPGGLLNDEAFRWFTRCAYDIRAGLTKEASAAKHLAELDAQTGYHP